MRVEGLGGSPASEGGSWRSRDLGVTSWCWHRGPSRPGPSKSWLVPALPPPLASRSGRQCQQPSWPSPAHPRCNPGKSGGGCAGRVHLQCPVSPSFHHIHWPRAPGPERLSWIKALCTQTSILDAPKDGRGGKGDCPPSGEVEASQRLSPHDRDKGGGSDRHTQRE